MKAPPKKEDVKKDDSWGDLNTKDPKKEEIKAPIPKKEEEKKDTKKEDSWGDLDTKKEEVKAERKKDEKDIGWGVSATSVINDEKEKAKK